MNDTAEQDSGNAWLPKMTTSTAALVVANLIPVGGVLFFGWELYPLLLLYWLENVIVGLFNVVKMAINRTPEPGKLAQKLFLIPFFWMHYGGFVSIHGIFVINCFGKTGPSEVAISADQVMDVIAGQGLIYAVIGLVISHGVSFITNYIGKGEWKRQMLMELMGAPYGRVVVLHIFIIVGGFLLMALDSPTAGIVLLAVLKIAADLAFHARGHSKKVSLLRKRVQKLHESGLLKSGKHVDPLRDYYPDYRRDTAAETAFSLPHNIGYILALLLIVGGVMGLKRAPQPVAISLIGAGVVALVASAIQQNRRRENVPCRTCGQLMDCAEVDCPPQQLMGFKKTECHVGPDNETYVRVQDKSSSSLQVKRVMQRWYVCNQCRTYFRGLKRFEKIVANGGHEVYKLLNTCHHLADGP